MLIKPAEFPKFPDRPAIRSPLWRFAAGLGIAGMLLQAVISAFHVHSPGKAIVTELITGATAEPVGDDDGDGDDCPLCQVIHGIAAFTLPFPPSGMIGPTALRLDWRPSAVSKRSPSFGRYRRFARAPPLAS